MSRSCIKKCASAFVLGSFGLLAMAFGQAVPAHASSAMPDAVSNKPKGPVSICSTNIVFAVYAPYSNNLTIKVKGSEIEFEKAANCIVKVSGYKTHRHLRMKKAIDPSQISSQAIKPATPMLNQPAITGQSPMINQPTLTQSPMINQPTLTQSPMLNQPTLTQSPMISQPTLTQSPMINQPALTQSPMISQPTLTQSPMINQPALTQNPMVSSAQIASSGTSINPQLVGNIPSTTMGQ